MKPRLINVLAHTEISEIKKCKKKEFNFPLCTYVNLLRKSNVQTIICMLFIDLADYYYHLNILDIAVVNKCK